MILDIGSVFPFFSLSARVNNVGDVPIGDQTVIGDSRVCAILPFTAVVSDQRRE